MRVLTPLVTLVVAILFLGCSGDPLTGPVDEGLTADFTPVVLTKKTVKCKPGDPKCKPPPECSPKDPKCKPPPCKKGTKKCHVPPKCEPNKHKKGGPGCSGDFGFDGKAAVVVPMPANGVCPKGFFRSFGPRGPVCVKFIKKKHKKPPHKPKK